MAEYKAQILKQGLLTQKQIDALELLVKHNTSKEISRILGISPHTVDQRIESAKRRLVVGTRRELVQAYLNQKRTCHSLTYDESQIAEAPHPIQISTTGNESAPAMFATHMEDESRHLIESIPAKRIVPQLFEGRKGTLHRLIAILAASAMMAILILAMIAIFAQVSAIVSR